MDAREHPANNIIHPDPGPMGREADAGAWADSQAAPPANEAAYINDSVSSYKSDNAGYKHSVGGGGSTNTNFDRKTRG